MTNILSNKYVGLLINFFKYGMLFCIIPPFLNYAALNRETPVLGSHGLPYDISMGQKLFLSCKGEGLPTIIMESPIGLNSDIWVPLQEKLSQITKTCIYDRAGLGLSERPFDPVTNNTEALNKLKMQRGREFTIERMVDDLRKLISSSSQQERPIMFIGSEMGSLVGRFYAQIYENDLSHLVMINPLVENLFMQEDLVWKNYWYESILPKWYSYALGSVIGLNRFLLMGDLIKPQIYSPHLKEETQNRQKHLMCNPKHLFTLVDEFANINETLAQMKLIWTIKQFPKNISVTIVSSNSDEMFAVSEFIQNKDSSRNTKLKNAWRSSIDFLKNNLHPNANLHNIDESIYKLLNENPTKIFNIIEDLIVKWRRSTVTTKKI